MGTTDPQPMPGAESGPRPLATLRTSGILWYLNRVAFHPRGFALALTFEDDVDPDTSDPIGWQIVGDGSEIWSFSPDVEDDLFDKIEALFAEHRAST